MTIPFPTKPWEDGEEFKYVLPNGESILLGIIKVKMLGHLLNLTILLEGTSVPLLT